MELMELPLEVLHIILFYAALGRGIKRALRLRLVCKAFAGALYPALFETHIMDYHRSNPIGTDVWQAQIQCGAEKLWQEYLVYRVMNERDPTVGRFIEIRQIAQAICQEMESLLDLHATVEALCWLVLTHGTKLEGGRDWKKWWYPLLQDSESRASLGLNTLLSAAAYFDLLPLARRLVAEGHRPTSPNYLFAPPIQVAAQAGNIAMLRLFQEQLPDFNFEPFSVTGAAIRGDIDIVKLALRLPARTGQSEGGSDGDNMNDQQFGSIEYTSETGKAILISRSCTSSPEVYDYLTSSLAPWPTKLFYAHNDLRKYAELGNLPMVRHLLHIGVPVQVSGMHLETPLVMACRGWHNDIVDLLLEHGADPNFPGQTLYPLFPLHVSATASNLSLARTLLDRGALPNRPGGRPVSDRLPALWWAFAREHTEMIRLLLERGASLDGGLGDVFGKGWVGKSLAEMTSYLGYHSMVDILRQYGFEIIDPPTYTAQNAPFWCHWAEVRARAPQP